MGKVAVLLKIMPESPEVDLDRLENEVKEKVSSKAEIKDSGLEPVAFGLRALKILIYFEDKEGVLDQAIEEIQSIGGIQSVDVEKMDLL